MFTQSARSAGADLVRSLVALAPRTAAVVAIATALVVLVFGWGLDVAVLRSLGPSYVTMKPNAAVAFLASGVALLLRSGEPSDRRRVLATVCAGLAAAIGLLTLAEYAHVPGLDIDQLLFREGPDAAFTRPGRMAFLTAASYVLLGSALMMSGWITARGRWPSGILVGPVIQISLLVLVGYAFGVETFHGVGLHTAMALHTAVLFLVLSIGLVCMRPELGLVAILTGTGPGGVMARSLSGGVFTVPLVVGWLLHQGAQTGVISIEFALAFFVMASVGSFMGLLWANGFLLDRVDAERARVAEEKYRAMLREEAAQNAVRERDEFVLVASHELRTPIAALHLTLQGLQRRLRTQDKIVSPEQMSSALESATRQVVRLAKLVEDVLDTSRIESGRIELNVEEVDLTAVVRRALEPLDTLLQSAGCRIELHADSAVIGTWDVLRMEQVVTNLVANAMKYGRGAPIQIEVGERGDVATLTVRDQGIGIPPEDLERVFGRFERAVSSQNYAGLGIGLFIARFVVEAHGGSIRAESLRGAGSTFSIELPRQPPGGRRPQRGAPSMTAAPPASAPSPSR